MLTIIVSVSNSGVIGNDNTLLWHLPNDLKRFKSITTGKTIIMGRKTFESLPGVLAGRKHIVLTRDKSYKVDHEYVEVIYTIEELFTVINQADDNFVIGGGEIYKLLLPYTERIYITKVIEDYAGDTYFPEIDLKVWKPFAIEDGIIDEKNKILHQFIYYKRR